MQGKRLSKEEKVRVIRALAQPNAYGGFLSFATIAHRYDLASVTVRQLLRSGFSQAVSVLDREGRLDEVIE